SPSTAADPVIRAEQTIKELMLSMSLGSDNNADNIADMSVSEIFELSEALYAGNMKKQEETFDRVLKSLESLPVPAGAMVPSSGHPPTAALADVRKDPNYLLIQSIYNENKRAREQREIDRVVRKNEIAE